MDHNRRQAEDRSLSLADALAEIRTDDTTSEQRFVGHAAVFGIRAAIGNPLKWGFYEEIAAGAFTKTISEGDARMLIDHDSFYVVSRVSAGTLLLAQDARGLAVDSALDAELSYVKDLKANLANKNITGMSFGFYVVKDAWTDEEIEVDGLDEPVVVEVRTIQEVRLIEVSAVTFPAYEDTDAGLRAVRRALLHRGDADAIRRRIEHKPELRSLLDELPRGHAEVSSDASEPGETTRETSVEDAEATEPGETTRNAPSIHDQAAARLRVLHSTLRRPAA